MQRPGALEGEAQARASQVEEGAAACVVDKDWAPGGLAAPASEGQVGGQRSWSRGDLVVLEVLLSWVDLHFSHL